MSAGRIERKRAPRSRRTMRRAPRRVPATSRAIGASPQTTTPRSLKPAASCARLALFLPRPGRPFLDAIFGASYSRPGRGPPLGLPRLGTPVRHGGKQPRPGAVARAAPSSARYQFFPPRRCRALPHAIVRQDAGAGKPGDFPRRRWLGMGSAMALSGYACTRREGEGPDAGGRLSQDCGCQNLRELLDYNSPLR